MLIDTTTHAGEDIEKKEGTFLISWSIKISPMKFFLVFLRSSG